jgi:hypothetical protein
MDNSGCLLFPYGIGTSLSVVISWEMNHSIFWGTIHGALSWFYVVYYFLFL